MFKQVIANKMMNGIRVLALAAGTASGQVVVATPVPLASPALSAVAVTAAEPAELTALGLIRQAILRVQPSGGRVCVPLDSTQIQSLRASLAREGVVLTARETEQAVDVASAFLRENPSAASFVDKIQRGIEHRPGFHGNVTEVTEARLRNMVQTKDIQSTTWDLTERTARPRNLQMKISNDVQGAIDDVKGVASKMKAGRARAVMPQETLDQAVTKGLLRRHEEFYAPVTGENITLMPSKAVKTVAESRAYAAEGESVLARLANTAARPATGSRTAAAVGKAGTRAIAPASTAVLVDDVANGSSLLRVIKSPGLGAGGVTLAIDGGIAAYRYFDGQINKAELAEEITDAVVKAAAVGLSVQVVYLMATTPHGLVVAGVAILTYVAADALISYIRSEYGNRYVKVSDLKGIAPSEFLNNLRPTLGEAGKGSPTQEKLPEAG